MLTDVGRVRKIDEDSIMSMDLSFAVDSKNSEFRLLIVADGMGGHAKGEEASRMALLAISRTVLSGLFEDVPFTDLLKRGIENANRDVLGYVDENPESAGMGTTAVCALVRGNEVYLANIGDSRIYVVSEEEIRRVTRDHSYVQELVDAGSITEKESRIHPKKNIITKAIGAAETAEPDASRLTLDSDESLLLCCDGVTAHLEDNDIQKIVRRSGDPQAACKDIVDTANERGGTDNISLILLSPSGEDGVPSGEDDVPTTIKGGSA
ncbi:MAG: Stp1/IreP family PP2C-type Ser/Thr phosphatase [Alphaproteobacteria bacterium]|nr:Stp1/IreP family PP2C-type Ser/Thr phosphatase [Alphaproteobacteria bacterium]